MLGLVSAERAWSRFGRLAVFASPDSRSMVAQGFVKFLHDGRSIARCSSGGSSALLGPLTRALTGQHPGEPPPPSTSIADPDRPYS